METENGTETDTDETGCVGLEEGVRFSLQKRSERKEANGNKRLRYV